MGMRHRVKPLAQHIAARAVELPAEIKQIHSTWAAPSDERNLAPVAAYPSAVPRSTPQGAGRCGVDSVTQERAKVRMLS